MNIIPKGQIRWLPKTEVIGQARFIERTLGIAASGKSLGIAHGLASTPMFATLPARIPGGQAG